MMFEYISEVIIWQEHLPVKYIKTISFLMEEAENNTQRIWLCLAKLPASPRIP